MIANQPNFERLVQRAFDTIRQAAVGMPAIMIRQLDALAKIVEQTPDRTRRTVLIRQAEAIQKLNLDTVPDPGDRDDVTRRYEMFMASGLLGRQIIARNRLRINGFPAGSGTSALGQQEVAHP